MSVRQKTIRFYEQTTSESCLSACLLMLLDKNPTRKKELSVLIEGLKFTKWNFTAGHLNYIAKKYGVNIRWYVEFKRWFDFLKQLPISPQVKIENSHIDKKFIDCILTEGNTPIILLDSYWLHFDIHYPHYVTIIGKSSNTYSLYDPWEGVKNKSITVQILHSSLSDLRKRLNYSPQLITIECD